MRAWILRARLAAVLLLCTSGAFAGTFTPEEGATITTNSLSVTWSSTASQQWVRIFNSSRSKLYDSGRLSSSSGQVGVEIPEDTTSITVFFYEKVGNGAWSYTERTYSVDIDNDSGGGGAVSPEQIVSALESALCEASEEITLTITGKLACHPKDPSLGCPVPEIEEFASEVISDGPDFCSTGSPNIGSSVSRRDGRTIVELSLNPVYYETFEVNGFFEARQCALVLGCENFLNRDFY